MTDGRDDSVIWMSLAALATVGILAIVFGMSASTFIYMVVLSVPVILVAKRVGSLATPWLGKVIFFGFLTKMIGSAARFWVAVEAYQGHADALTYYNSAIFHVHEWRQLVVPTITRRGGGTNFVENLTGLLFTPYVPDLLGGFFLFATIAFLGQIMFFVAFRRALPAVAHKRYAVAIFFWPSIVYWPSSIGKDAVIIFALGMAALGAATAFKGRWRTGSLWVAAGLTLAAAIRPHIAVLFFGAMVVALVIAKVPGIKGGQLIRLAMVIVMGAGLAIATVQLSASYDVQLNSDSIEGFSDQVQRNTTQGGSQVQGDRVRGLSDIPEATLRVLYRPLIHEAGSVQVLVSAIEGTILLGITLIAAPRILRNLWAGRHHQYVVLAMAYSFGFVIAFSTFFNLGIIARQRVQVLPLMLAGFVALTLKHEQLFELELEPDEATVVTRPPAVVGSRP